jgi:hypothetical protein
MFQFKMGRIPALVDTGAQFSCIRSDVIEYLYAMGENSKFSSCSAECVLADGKVCKVSDAVVTREDTRVFVDSAV